MYNPTQSCADTDLRSLLKQKHKTVYSICRLFARTYKEHQRLFIDVIAAASQNIRFKRSDTTKQTMLWRACINMAALHSITTDETPYGDMKFKSPDYQRSMIELGNSIGDASDYEKFQLFLDLEDIRSEDLFGSINRPAPKAAGSYQLIPFLKEKLIWS